MGFIDYHGTKEDRYTDVLEYARAQQEEDWKRKDEKKVSLWLQELIGNNSYVQLNIEDLIKYVVIKYRSMQRIWKNLERLLEIGEKMDIDQIWKDFSLDFAARHLSSFPLSPEKKIKYLEVFQKKIFKIEGALSVEDHYRFITEIPEYRQYFTECFDPTWKGQHFYKWLQICTKKNPEDYKLLDEFLEADIELSLFLALYLHQIILPHDDGWMREAEAERKALIDIQGKIHRGTLFSPDWKYLKNPLCKSSQDNHAETDRPQIERESKEIPEETGTAIPESGLNKMKFNALIQNGTMNDYIAASKLLLECSLPEDIAQTYRQLIERMPILLDAINRFDDIYHADMDQFEEYFAPEALRITAVYLDYQAVSPSERLLKETRESVSLATRKLLQVVNEKIDEIYRFVMIDANAEARALETLMSQDGHVNLEHRIR